MMRFFSSKELWTFAGNPGFWLPHLKRRTLLDLPSPLGPSLPTQPRIRALILDKDNTLCPPNTTFVHPLYQEAVNALKASPEFAHHPRSILIVSNTAGKTSSPRHEDEARDLEAQFSLPVVRQWQVRQGIKKPAIGKFLAESLVGEGVVSNPQEIVVVGDKILKDVLMARSMRSWSVFLEDGWRDPDDPTQSYHDWGTWWERKLLQFPMDVFNSRDNEEALLMPWERPQLKTWKQFSDDLDSYVSAYLRQQRAKQAGHAKRVQKLEELLKLAEEDPKFALRKDRHGGIRFVDYLKRELERDRILDEEVKKSARRRLDKVERAPSSQTPNKPSDE